jgi:vesicle-fusing ATPase
MQIKPTNTNNTTTNPTTKMSTMSFKVTKCPSAKLSLTNKVYMNASDMAAFDQLRKKAVSDETKRYVKVKELIFTYEAHDDVPAGQLAFTSAQRRSCELALDDKLELKPYSSKSDNVFVSSVKLLVDFLTKKPRDKKADAFDAKAIAELFVRSFAGQYLCVEQQFVLELHKENLVFTVEAIQVADLDKLTAGTVDVTLQAAKKTDRTQSESAAAAVAAAAPAPGSVPLTATDAPRGVLMNSSQIVLKKAPGSTLNLAGGEAGAVGGAGLLLDWDFEKMGIGGLDSEFNSIFRRAFASRIYPPAVMQKLGTNHVRGLLLYGPPGTGKTLIARQIGKMLNGREPKIVSGPEVLNKFVGQTEENIRNLFKEAEEEQKLRGIDSDLHIIIMDELDALCRVRGSSSASAAVGDTIVNQLLAKIDGVESLNNILVIGMTNRKELIDPALLRPGRLEVHVEISLPDADGRVQILKIHTAAMRANGFMEATVDIDDLARNHMKNYSGAEIEGVVKAAQSWAMQRQVNPSNLKQAPKPEDLRVIREDFDRAIAEVKPSFGVATDDFESAVPNGIVSFSREFDHTVASLRAFVEQVHHSRRTPLVSVLLEGNRGSGKTALAATVALQSGFPFVKLVSPDKLVGAGEQGRVDALVQAFNDAYKSPMSVLVIDDIERMIEYVPSMPARFSNPVLQCLAVLLRKTPPKGRRLIVIGTCANRRALEELQLSEAFDATLQMPEISSQTELRTFLTHRSIAEFDDSELDLERVVSSFPSGLKIGVKKLIMLLEMAHQGSASGVADRFINILQDFAMKRL